MYEFDKLMIHLGLEMFHNMSITRAWQYIESCGRESKFYSEDEKSQYIYFLISGRAQGLYY